MAEAIEQGSTTTRQKVRRTRLRWLMFVVFSFLAFESVLFALALQGPWLVLLAPGLVCGIKAAETYRETSRIDR